MIDDDAGSGGERDTAGTAQDRSTPSAGAPVEPDGSAGQPFPGPDEQSDGCVGATNGGPVDLDAAHDRAS